MKPYQGINDTRDRHRTKRWCWPTLALLLGLTSATEPLLWPRPSAAVETPHAPVVLPAAAAANRSWPPYDPKWFSEVWQGDEVVSEAALRSLLESVPGGTYRIEQGPEGPWRFRFLEGSFRLRTQFEEGKALKLGLIRPERLSLFLVAPPEIIELRYHPNYYQAWAAYAIEPVSPENPLSGTPSALLATDQGRYRRSGLGTVFLFWKDGQLVLARGAVRLFTVPLKICPQEIWGVVRTRVREFAWVEGLEPPPDDEDGLLEGFVGGPTGFPKHELVAGSRPADLGWSLWAQNGAQLQWHEDGSVELGGEEIKERTYAAFPVPRSRALEIVARFREATPGTGLFVADGDRRPIAGLGFFRRPGTGQLLFGYHSAQDDTWERAADNNQILPLTKGDRWFRLVVGGGIVKWWISPDGKHWSLVAPTAENTERAAAFCGLFLTRGQARRIHLEHIAVRELLDPARWCDRALADLVPESVFREPDPTRWWENVLRACPDEANLSDWVRACCIRSLEENPSSHLAQRILEQLWDEIAACDWPIEQKLAAGSRLALLASPRDWGVYERMPQRLGQMMWRELRFREMPAFSLLSDWYLRTPYWAEWRLPAFSEPLYRQELFAALAKDDREHLARLGVTVSCWAVPGSDAVSEALRYLGSVAIRRAGHQAVVRTPFAVDTHREDHPLKIEMGKPAYNFLQELQAMLGNRDYEGAARFILQAGEVEIHDFFPSPSQAGVWLSLPCYLESLKRQAPGFASALHSLGEKIGRLQLEQARATGREDVAGQILDRLPGTDSAAEAALWLGDRRLVLGRAAEAYCYYQKVLARSPEKAQGDLAERLKILRAIDPGIVPPESLAQVPADHHPQKTLFVPVVPVLPVGSLELRPRFTVESPGHRRAPSLPERELDWPGQQLGLVADDDLLLVHAQAEIRMYDMATGTLLWAQQSTLQGDQRGMPLVRMRPFIQDGRVIGRVLQQHGPELAALDMFDGHIIWNLQPEGHVISDPWRLGNEVYAVVAKETEGERVDLALACVDPQAGRLRSLKPLFSLRNTIGDPLDCRMASMGTRFVGQLRGTVFLGDVTGNVAWVRAIPWVAPPSDSWWPSQDWYLQDNPPPLVCEEGIVVTARGSWCITCLVPEDGSVKWQRAIGRLAGLLGYRDTKLYVKTTRGVEILDARSGDWLAEISHPGVQEWLYVEDPPALVALAIVTAPQGRGDSRLEVTWYRPDDGVCIGQASAALPDRRLSWLGPVIVQQNHVLLFCGSFASPTVRSCFHLEISTGGG